LTVGAVIKRYGRVVPGEVLDARAAAEAVRRAAHDELVQGRATLAAEREAARREGHAEGRAQGAAEIVAELAGARARAQRELTTSAPAAIALGRKMAEMIIARQIALDPAAMADLVAAALASCRPTAGTVTVRLHPDELGPATARRDALAARVPAAAELRFVADVSVGRHGCIVDMPGGQLDARLETQLAALERALLEGGGVG
jgi:flagellar biosynthesis/type III secretory pathway protein FliH